jgi:hypothetical protein
MQLRSCACSLRQWRSGKQPKRVMSNYVDISGIAARSVERLLYMLFLNIFAGFRRSLLTLEAFSSSPVPRLPLQERTNGPEIALVSQKVGLFGTL